MDINALDVLCCKITIGDPDPDRPIMIKNAVELTELEEIEIHESYKELIGTAKLKFPKGSVYKSTIIGAATLEGRDASRITAEVMQDGVVIEKRSTQSAIDETTFKIGQRVNIKLGYNGLLKDTGFFLHSDTKKLDIEIGKVKVTDNFTVADILNEWSRYRVYCFLKYDADSPDEMPAIAIGRPYSSSKSRPVFPDNESAPFRIRFDYHVAKNDLKILKTDPKFLAVTGKALGSDEKFFEVTVRLNPEYDPANPSSKEFQTVNATQITKKKAKKTGNRTASGAETKTKVDLSTYTLVPYMSPNMNITSDKLVEETIEYFKNYNLNGITGSLTLFGDFGLPAAVQVELTDERNPSKNGVYLVEEVTTTFGTDGYRQKITVPHKIKSTNGDKK